ncbi:MAG: hypothetical protein ABFC88_12660 [Thermoguttaceae bacterium]
MPLAFAAVMDMPVEELMAEIGHDGGKILFRNLTEPACRQGFHIQELVHVALQHGLAMTPVELFPVLASADLRQTHTIIYPDNNWQRFANLLATTKGVIDGTGLRLRHMVAYDHGRIYDPKGFEYGYSRIACEAHGFHSQCAWRLDPLGVHE